jgi:hypothetical protein
MDAIIIPTLRNEVVFLTQDVISGKRKKKILLQIHVVPKHKL